MLFVYVNVWLVRDVLLIEFVNSFNQLLHQRECKVSRKGHSLKECDAPILHTEAKPEPSKNSLD